MEKHTGDNIGSFHTLYLCKTKDLENNDFNGLRFENIYFTEQTGKYSKAIKSSNNGSFWEHSISFDVPKYRPDVEAWLLLHIDVPLIAYIHSINGDIIRIGTKEMPLFLNVNLDLGQKFSDFNSYTFKGKADELLKRNFGITLASPKPNTIKSNELRFDRQKYNYITVPTNGLPKGDAEISISIKINFKDALESQTLFMISELQTNKLISLRYELERFVIVFYGIVFYTNTDFPSETYTITVSKSQGLIISNTKLYINGNLITMQNIGIDEVLNLQNIIVRLGIWITQQYAFNGTMQMCQIHNRALTQSEATQIANGEVITNGLLRHYKFNDSEGDILKDYSGNNANGILKNYDPINIIKGTQNHWQLNGSPVI